MPRSEPAATGLAGRQLPADEWWRLRAIEPFKSRGLPDDPTNWAVFVVERSGVIVGSCSLFLAMHWDCWWLDREEPGSARGVILRQLLRQALSTLDRLQVEQVYTGVEDHAPGAEPFLRRFGFQPAAGKLFILQVADAATALREGA